MTRAGLERSLHVSRNHWQSSTIRNLEKLLDGDKTETALSGKTGSTDNKSIPLWRNSSVPSILIPIWKLHDEKAALEREVVELKKVYLQFN